MSLFCQYAHEVVWPELIAKAAPGQWTSPPEWKEVEQALCGENDQGS